METVKKITKAYTKLDFGALPYRPHEMMFARAEISQLNALGWKPEYSLENGLEKTISWYSSNLEK